MQEGYTIINGCIIKMSTILLAKITNHILCVYVDLGKGNYEILDFVFENKKKFKDALYNLFIDLEELAQYNNERLSCTRIGDI